MVVGVRFSAFWPLGIKATLEHDFFFLAQAFQWSWDQVLKMPSSLRHRTVKFQEEVVRIRNQGRQGTQSAGTTWWQRMQTEKKPS